MKDLSRNVSLMCGVCGNQRLKILDDNIESFKEATNETKIKCLDCGRIITKEELMEENSEVIQANIEELKKDVLNELKKEIKKRFR